MTSVREPSALPVHTASTLSKSLPAVVIVILPAALGVRRYQSVWDLIVAQEGVRFSPVSTVAELVTMLRWVGKAVMGWALLKLSLIGANWASNSRSRSTVKL